MSNSVIRHSTLSEKVARTDVLVLLTHFSSLESRKHHVEARVERLRRPRTWTWTWFVRQCVEGFALKMPEYRRMSSHPIKLLLTSIFPLTSISTVQISNYSIIFVIPYKKSEIKSFGKCASLQRSILKIQSQSTDMLKGFFGL